MIVKSVFEKNWLISLYFYFFTFWVNRCFYSTSVRMILSLSIFFLKMQWNISWKLHREMEHYIKYYRKTWSFQVKEFSGKLIHRKNGKFIQNFYLKNKWKYNNFWIGKKCFVYDELKHKWLAILFWQHKWLVLVF